MNSADIHNSDLSDLLMLAHVQDRATLIKAIMAEPDFHAGRALIRAVNHNLPDLALALIESGIDVNFQDYRNQTPLMHAAANGHTEVVLALIEKGAHLDVQDTGGSTALIQSLWKGQHATGRVLIDKGADLNKVNKHGMTALHWAVIHHEQDQNIVQSMVDKGVDTAFKSPEHGSALDWAISKGLTGLQQILGKAA